MLWSIKNDDIETQLRISLTFGETPRHTLGITMLNGQIETLGLDGSGWWDLVRQLGELFPRVAGKPIL